MIAWLSGLQEVQAELGAVKQLLTRCQSSFYTLVQHYGEHPASTHDLEFWRDIQTFVAALSAAQQRHKTQSQVSVPFGPPPGNSVVGHSEKGRLICPAVCSLMDWSIVRMLCLV